MSAFEENSKMIEIIDNKICIDGKAYAAIAAVDGAADTFEKIKDGA